MQDNGFIDLRVSQHAQGGEDSVWPSFTDIMTVIVMIFLMALAIMMVRNLELDQRLTTSLSAQELGLLENRSLTDRLDTLEQRFFETQESLGETVSQRDKLRAQLLTELQRIERLSQDNTSLEQQLIDIITERNLLAEESRERGEALGAARGQITDLTRREAELSRTMAALNAQFSELELSSEQEIAALGDTNRSLSEQLELMLIELAEVKSLLQKEQTERQQSRSNYAGALTEINALKALIRQRQAENAALQQQADSSEGALRSLQDEYESLDVRYRQLVRPARNTAGKYVVDVRITKDGNDYRYSLREPGETEPVTYTRLQLDTRLADIQEKQGASNLYTKIIYTNPEQISQSDAWQFTSDILQKYDYYDQQDTDTPGTNPSQP